MKGFLCFAQKIQIILVWKHVLPNPWLYCKGKNYGQKVKFQYQKYLGISIHAIFLILSKLFTIGVAEPARALTLAFARAFSFKSAHSSASARWE